jgi:hypothetical protein
MFDYLLHQRRVKCQDEKVRGCLDIYIYNKLGGGLHAGVECLDLFLLSFSVHRHCYVSTNMKSGLDEVRIVPQGLCNMWVLSLLLLRPWHRWSFTRFRSIRSPESKRHRILRGGFGILNWVWPWGLVSNVTARVGGGWEHRDTFGTNRDIRVFWAQGFNVFGVDFPAKGLGGFSTFGDPLSSGLFFAYEAEEISWGTLHISS